MNIADRLSPYNISNLETLSAFLKSGEIPPPRFHIGTYADFIDLLNEKGVEFRGNDFSCAKYLQENMEAVYGHCGTTVCAVGHGPLAGMPMLPGEDWHNYELRVFGVGQYGPNSSLWQFMFAGGWSDNALNNTAKGTAARIDYVLKHGGPPELWSYYNHGVYPEVWFDGLDTSTFVVDKAVESA